MPFIPCVPSSSRFLTFARHLVLAVLAVVAGATIALAQTPPAPRGPVEGIKVHGHWTIDIRNADGTLASHHEFENALVNPDMLVTSLMGDLTPGGWRIRLASNNNPQQMPCGPSKPCVIREQHAKPATFETESTNLILTLISSGTTSGPAQATLHFDGSITSGTGSPLIQVVTSQLSYCSAATAPSQCVNPSAVADITEHTLTAPIPVVAGQIIQVTVDLTFS